MVGGMTERSFSVARFIGRALVKQNLFDQFCSPEALVRKQRAIVELHEKFGSRLSTATALRRQHGRGESLDIGMPPDAVVWPESKEEVQTIIDICRRNVVPIIPFGAGTSLEGHVSAPFGGVSIDMAKMSRVIAVHPEDGDCVVEPGITRQALNSYLRQTGLFFSVDPGADASLGGMASTRASGTTTVRYGPMAHNVMAIEVAMADGNIVRFGSRARKSAAGYDLLHAFVGAEGTLGIITELTLRLHPQPQEIGTAACSFPSLRSAVQTVAEISQFGIQMARMEFLDELQIRACNQYSKLNMPEKPTLFLEFHGSPVSVREQIDCAQEIATANGCFGFEWAVHAEERNRLWAARHSAYYAALALRPGCADVVADVCVPISQLADSVTAARSDIDQAGLVAPILGHVGDGNFHVIFLMDSEDSKERERVTAVYDAMIKRAHAVGGTCTGEHGVGIGKRERLIDEFGPESVGLMRSLKSAWDPLSIFNPGKVFADSE